MPLSCSPYSSPSRNWNWKRIKSGEYVSGNGKFTIVRCQNKPRGRVYWMWGHIPSMNIYGFECLAYVLKTRRAAIAELEADIDSRPSWFPVEDIPAIGIKASIR